MELRATLSTMVPEPRLKTLNPTPHQSFVYKKAEGCGGEACLDEVQKALGAIVAD